MSINQFKRLLQARAKDLLYIIDTSGSRPMTKLIEVSNLLTGGGKSAYDVAVANGYQGTEQQWLVSLKGDTGSFALPTTTKTTSIDSDFLILFDSNNNPYRITKSEFLAGISSSPSPSPSPSPTPSPSSTNLVWVSNGDSNGLFYFLGLNNGIWSNPANTSNLEITASSVHFPSIPLTTITDRQPGNFHTSNTSASPWIEINLRTRKLKLTRWNYQARNDSTSNRPTRIAISGSNDGTNYTALDDKSGLNISPGTWYGANVSTTQSFSRIRLTMPSLNNENQWYFTIGEIELYGELFS